jgi:fructoselysine-6-P-deglycase FrlB-like protein
MTFLQNEIARQPASWRRAAEIAQRHAAALPADGERVLAIGCGTSAFMADSYARLREAAGRGETDACPASEFRPGRGYCRLLVISRSGTTTELLRLLASLDGRLPVTVLTAVPDSPLAAAASHPIALPFADESSVVQTVFATTVLAVLRASLGEDVAALADTAETVLAAELPPAWPQVEQITFLGSGFGYGIACEAALKLREAAQFWAESYPSMEYRHGPISIAAPGRLVWQFGPDAGRLRTAVAGTGAGFVDDALDPMVDLLRAQRLALAIASARGLDPDRPRHLSRSVILDG